MAAQPACQILPPPMPGYRPYCPYTINPGPAGAWTAPNLARAEKLVRASGTHGATVTVLAGRFADGAPDPPTGRYAVSVLRQLGYRASLRVISPDAYYQRAGDSRRRVQAGGFDWFQDFPAQSDFIVPLFACRSFLPGNPANLARRGRAVRTRRQLPVQPLLDSAHRPALGQVTGLSPGQERLSRAS